ncbi:hypothetical protein SNEBB_002739 [Seison nebaliae]|nr:hypothetical protein SNEBB_002739 [Seison nebaliae]
MKAISQKVDEHLRSRPIEFGSNALRLKFDENKCPFILRYRLIFCWTKGRQYDDKDASGIFTESQKMTCLRYVRMHHRQFRSILFDTEETGYLPKPTGEQDECDDFNLHMVPDHLKDVEVSFDDNRKAYLSIYYKDEVLFESIRWLVKELFMCELRRRFKKTPKGFVDDQDDELLAVDEVRRAHNALTLDVCYNKNSQVYLLLKSNIVLVNESLPLVNFMEKLFGGNLNNIFQYSNKTHLYRVSSTMKGLQIYSTHDKKEHTISYLSTKSAGDHLVGRQPFCQVFEKWHSVRVTRPYLPYVKVDQSELTIPIEFCSLVPFTLSRSQKLPKDLFRKVTSDGIERSQKLLKDFVKNIDLKDFGISYATPDRYEKFRGETYEIISNDSKSVKEQHQIDLAKRSWVLIGFGNQKNSIINFNRIVEKFAKSDDIKLQTPKWVETLQLVELHDLMAKIREHKIEFIVALIDNDCEYSSFKTISEIEYGIVNQCVKIENIKKEIMDENYLTSLFRQIEMKLNGRFPLKKRQLVLKLMPNDGTTCFIGISIKKSKDYHFIAMVASADSMQSELSTVVRKKTYVNRSQSVYDCIGEMFAICMAKWTDERLPQNIIIFRSLLGPISYDDLLAFEMRTVYLEIRDKFPFAPKLLYIVTDNLDSFKIFAQANCGNSTFTITSTDIQPTTIRCKSMKNDDDVDSLTGSVLSLKLNDGDSDTKSFSSSTSNFLRSSDQNSFILSAPQNNSHNLLHATYYHVLVNSMKIDEESIRQLCYLLSFDFKNYRVRSPVVLRYSSMAATRASTYESFICDLPGQKPSNNNMMGSMINQNRMYYV